MHIDLVAVGTKAPAWVKEGYKEYALRMPRECSLNLLEIPSGTRTRAAGTGARAIEQESGRMLAAVPQRNIVVALEESGLAWSTRALAKRLEHWMQSGQNVSLLVGGPDGLSDACRSRADQRWSLSPLTLPHMLVRVVVAEQLYRAWTVLVGHPYHRD